MAVAVALHSRSMGRSPKGKFAFPINTRFGDLEQNNTWEISWEAFWTKTMREILQREEKVRGNHNEVLVNLEEQSFAKVLPRCL